MASQNTSRGRKKASVVSSMPLLVFQATIE